MVVESTLFFLDGLHKEILFFASICFIIGSVDDTIFDVLWIGHKLKRKLLIYPKHQRATVESLPISSNSEALAVFVPAWQEADVIGAMLKRCLHQWTYSDYRIYVGCYPNDPATIAAVAAAVSGSDKVRLVVCEEHGPTSKADCLNRLWKALCQDEILESKTYGAVILHDAEDIVHPEALKVFGHLIGRASLVQIPVIPRRALKSRWIAGHYGDEFAELHAKQMVLREALGVSLPSAGVGCAFARSALARISIQTRGKPFDAASMTEDYELGLKLTGAGARGIFARLKDRKGQLVATQEFFPDNLEDAVRQKARWMAGIALTGWDRLGWKRCWRENWMRLRDRKASFAAIILALAYVAIALTGLLWICSATGLYQMQPISTPLKIMLGLNAVFLAWRLVIKGYFVFLLYGFREALLSVPRTLVANIINIMAARRALALYVRSLAGTPIRWDKTSHFYPELGEIQQLKTATQSSSE